MSMVAATLINDPVCEDIFGLLGEVGLDNWWQPVQVMPRWVVVVRVVRFEEADVEHQMYR